MLKSKILPSGIGHTTNCFVQVEGTDSTEGYIMSGNVKESVHSVKQLAHALCDDKVDVDSLIRICWPKEKCSLLRDDVVLIDR
jgi:mitofusin